MVPLTLSTAIISTTALDEEAQTILQEMLSVVPAPSPERSRSTLQSSTSICKAQLAISQEKQFSVLREWNFDPWATKLHGI